MQDPDSQLAFSKFRMLALRTFVVQAQSRKWHVLVSPETSDQAANAALKPSKNTGKPIMFLKGVRWYRERMHAGSYCLGSLPARTVAQRHKSPAALAEVLGPSHFYVAMTLDSIANLKDRLGQLEEEPSRQHAVMEEALAYACRSLSIWEKVFGPIHPHIAKILYNLAGRKDSLGEVEESLRLYDRALDIHEHLRSEDVELADVLGATANLRERLGEFSVALNLYSRLSASSESRVHGPYSDTEAFQTLPGKVNWLCARSSSELRTRRF